MSWTTPAELKAQVQKLWDRGLLLSSLIGGESVFPRRLTLKGPDSRELSDSFTEVLTSANFAKFLVSENKSLFFR